MSSIDTIYPGDNETRPFQILDANGDPQDITGWIEFRYRCFPEGDIGDQPGDEPPSTLVAPNGSHALQFTLTDDPAIVVVTDAVNGLLEVQIPNSGDPSTENLTPGTTYREQLQSTNAASEKQTPIDGRFRTGTVLGGV